MALRSQGWNNLATDIEREVSTIYRDAARVMYEQLAERDGTDPGSGSPLASGQYSASMRIGLDRTDMTSAPRDRGYHYPSPERHKYSGHNLPPATIRATPRSVVSAWLRPFRLSQHRQIVISNASAYAIVLEEGRRGKTGSWQRPKGIFLPTLDKLFAQNGWY